MKQEHQGRRAVPGAAAAQPGIDAVLRRAVDAGEVPGVVAMAATDQGVFYEGAFGLRNTAQDTAMTLDTVFRIASMTKAVTSVAAMQLVEQGKLALDGPLPDIDPALSAPQVLEGFDPSGAPRLRPARRPITLRHLLTHTAGFSYEVWNAETARYIEATGTPARSTGRIASIRLPLVFDPGGALGVRRQHRLGRAAGRGGQRTAAGRLLPAAHLRSAWPGGYRFRSRGHARPTGTAGERAPTAGGRLLAAATARCPAQA